MGWFSFHVMSLVFVAGAFGGMLVAIFCVMPIILNTLPRTSLFEFWQRLFPLYNGFQALLLVVAIAFLIPGGSYWLEIFLLAAAALPFLVMRIMLLRRFDTLVGADPAAFTRIYRLSIAVNLLQLTAVTITLIRLAQ